MNITHQQELLQQIAAGVNKLERVTIANLKVTFENADGQNFDFSLATALDALANDIYWDERGNWADAMIARVETF